MTDWLYDETNHVGVDYSKDDHADIYDEQMAFRDYEAEVAAFLDTAGITEPEKLVAADIGCGTGAFTVHAARRFRKIYAVDVSEAMQKIARAKAERDGIENIEFVQAGFLRFVLDQPVDVVNTKWAFHHLPDFWKQAALLRINAMLKPGGLLNITDVVFRFDPDWQRATQGLVDSVAERFDPDFVDEVKVHIKEEYSTFGWIVRGMLERAGFEILHVDEGDQLACTYLCRKVASFVK